MMDDISKFIEKLDYHPMEAIFAALQRYLEGPVHPCVECNQLFDDASNLESNQRTIARQYQSLALSKQFFSDTIEWDMEWFDPVFWTAFHQGKLNEIFKEEASGIFSFPLMSKKFCQMLMDEVEHYVASGLPVSRPNSMNNYGLILNDIGLSPLFTQLQRKFFQKIAQLLFPVEGASLDAHHTFIVQYKQGEDLGLDMHVDDSEVTFNVCLGKEFEASGLTFCGSLGHTDHRQQSLSYSHIPGRAVVHLGNRRHGADDIISGERVNLIMWNYCHIYRYSNLYYDRSSGADGAVPSRICLSRTHDDDYEDVKKLYELL